MSRLASDNGLDLVLAAYVPGTGKAQRPGLKTSPGRPSIRDLREVEPVRRHDLVPGGDEVVDELLGRVVAGVDLGQRPQLRVGPEHEVDGRSRADDIAARAVASFEDVLGLG